VSKKTKRRFYEFLTAVILALYAADGGPVEVTSEESGRIQVDTPSNELGFTALYDEILAREGCSLAFCHGSDARLGNTDLSTRDKAYAALVGVPASGPACRDSGLVRVVPGEPDLSLLLMKLSAEPPCGVSMPSADALLSPAQQLRIREWIERGAPRD
jgi:hypothetical protein